MQKVGKHYHSFLQYPTGIFLSLIYGQVSAPSEFRNGQKLTKRVFNTPNFLVLHFGENFMEI